jgi:catechol 2,3-dioxygenase-like lactoylglutathione lyase family enzyme
MTAPTARTAARPVLACAEPQLFVSNLEAATDFYCDKLGFQVAFVYGEPPFYGQVLRDGARLNLRHVDGPVFDASFRANERDALSATIMLDDANALFREYQARGVNFHQTMKIEPWGARTFIVADPDGNLVMFAGVGS